MFSTIQRFLPHSSPSKAAPSSTSTPRATHPSSLEPLPVRLQAHSLFAPVRSAFRSRPRPSAVPADGDCFFHSVIQLAGVPLKQRLCLGDDEPLTPQHVRRRMAGELADHLREYNDVVEAVRQVRPLTALIAALPVTPQRPLNTKDTGDRIALLNLIGNQGLERCDMLTSDQLQRVFEVASSAAEADRESIAGRLIDHFIDHNDATGDVRRRHGHLEQLTLEAPLPDSERTLDLTRIADYRSFVDAVGGQTAERCVDLTPDQQQHVYDIARSGSWTARACEMFAPLLAASFPGVRLGVRAPGADGPRTYVYGLGMEDPYWLELDLVRNHYSPGEE